MAEARKSGGATAEAVLGDGLKDQYRGLVGVNQMSGRLLYQRQKKKEKRGSVVVCVKETKQKPKE